MRGLLRGFCQSTGWASRQHQSSLVEQGCESGQCPLLVPGRAGVPHCLMAHTKYEAAAAPPVLWLTSVASPGMEAASHLTGADGAVTALHTAG